MKKSFIVYSLLSISLLSLSATTKIVSTNTSGSSAIAPSTGSIRLTLQSIINYAQTGSNTAILNQMDLQEYEQSTVQFKYPYTLNNNFTYTPAFKGTDNTQYNETLNFGYKDYQGSFNYIYSINNLNSQNITDISFGKSIQDFIFGPYELGVSQEPYKSQIAQINTTIKTNKAIINAVTYYFKVLEQQQKIDLDQMAIQVQQKDLASVKAKQAGGFSSTQDIQLSQVSLQELNSTLAQDTAAYNINMSNLKFTLKLPSSAVISLTSDSPYPNINSDKIQSLLKSYNALALQKLYAQNQVDTLQNRYDSVHNNDLPNLIFGLGYNWSFGWDAFATVSYNILPWTYNGSKINDNSKRNKITLAESQQNISTSVAQFTADFQDATANLAITNAKLSINQTNFNAAKIKFQNNVISYAEYLTSEQNYFESQRDYYSAVYNYNILVYTLLYPTLDTPDNAAGTNNKEIF